MRPRMRRLLGTITALALVAIAHAGRAARADDARPIFDAHIHYSHDAWAGLPPKEAVALLRRAGISRALVSSANDDGTLMLLAEAPDLVVPELPPYRKRGEFATWMKDETIPEYLEKRLANARYVALGEFHVYGRQVELPVVRRTIALAKRHRLFLHAHSDAEAIERIFKADPEARVIWAHAGFDRLERILELLRRYENLWCDLAVRGDPASGGTVHPDWRAAFEEFPDRFLLGTDTYSPERWHYVAPHAEWARGWLASLPKDLADRLAFGNGEAVVALMRASRAP